MTYHTIQRHIADVTDHCWAATVLLRFELHCLLSALSGELLHDIN